MADETSGLLRCGLDPSIRPCSVKQKSEEQIDHLVEMTALGRIGCVDGIADMVGMFTDERSPWVTEQNILVNGGFAV